MAKVGNVAADITSDGNTWFVTTSDGKKKEFTSEREAEEYVKKIKSGNSKVGNAYQYAGSIPIEKIPDNWRPEFPKAGYVVYYAPNKAKWFATEAEAKRFAESQDKAQKTGNSKVGNSYSWTERRGHQELYDPTVPFGGHVRGYVEKSKNGYTGAKTNGSIIISKKEFATEEEAKKFVENKQVGNSKVGNFTISEGVKGKQELETKYKNNLRVAKEALSRVSRKISGYENASNINWGHLGDIARIADLLSEI